MYKRIPKQIIKRSDEHVSYDNGKIMNEDLYKKTKVEAYLEEAQENIRKKEEQTQREIEENKDKILNDAYEKGYSEGKQTALDEALEIVRNEQAALFQEANDEYEKANTHLKRIMDETENFKQKFMEEKKDDILDLSLEIARRLVGEMVERNPETIYAIYEQAKNQIHYESRKIFVRMHPLSEKVLLTNDELQLDNRIQLLLDITLKPGDFVLETDRECIDAKIETQLNEIKNCLRGAF